MALTWSRIGVCPFLIAAISMHTETWDWIAAVLFILGSITDWFDGYYARKFNVITNMGKLMDPIADKILVASALIMLVSLGRVGPVIAILLLSRDILIGGIRAVAAAENVIIDAKSAGKWKTGMQMVSIPAIIIHVPVMGLPVYEAGCVLLWISVILSILSGFQYTQHYFKGRKAAF
jgi:CDP-diacylglycerol--glycerol-3-phosphate 3-phosphatidyltransferase